jgi:sec-independent protein translocase protein TatA
MPIGFHPLELIILLVLALLIFGPKRLPEMGSSIGKAIKEFRKGMNELTAPKDEHDEETKLPASSKDMSKLASAPVDSEASSSKTTSETSSQESKIE